MGATFPTARELEPRFTQSDALEIAVQPARPSLPADPRIFQILFLGVLLGHLDRDDIAPAGGDDQGRGKECDGTSRNQERPRCDGDSAPPW